MGRAPGDTPSDVVQVADAIRHFIVRRYLPGESPSNLLDDKPLRSIADDLSALMPSRQAELGLGRAGAYAVSAR
jgi:hypothetical protein